HRRHRPRGGRAHEHDRDSHKQRKTSDPAYPDAVWERHAFLLPATGTDRFELLLAECLPRARFFRDFFLFSTRWVPVLLEGARCDATTLPAPENVALGGAPKIAG